MENPFHKHGPESYRDLCTEPDRPSSVESRLAKANRYEAALLIA